MPICEPYQRACFFLFPNIRSNKIYEKFFDGYTTDIAKILLTSLHQKEDQVIAFKEKIGKDPLYTRF